MSTNKLGERGIFAPLAISNKYNVKELNPFHACLELWYKVYYKLYLTHKGTEA